MTVYKDEKQGTWYTIFRYADWTGKKKQKMKRGFRTKRDLSDITRLNQQLSIENDNLRNKGGWMLKEKQEKLEREIENVRVRNVKLNYLVNMSNVAAVETMRVERDDALLQAEEERQMALAMKEYCKNEVAKANKKANKRILEIKNKKEFWQIISITSLCVGVLIGQMI